MQSGIVNILLHSFAQLALYRIENKSNPPERVNSLGKFYGEALKIFFSSSSTHTIFLR